MIFLEHLQRTERLNKISGGQCVNIERYAEDYQNIQIDSNGIIYCDIPYRYTVCGSYAGFNHDRFYEWALQQTVPIYISEYSMPDDFVMIHGISKRQLSTANGASGLVTEGIWVSRKVAKELKDKCSFQMTLFDFL